MPIILDRQGNQLPPTVDQRTRTTIDRESILYSYQNTVETSYVGDVRHIVTKFGEYLQTKNHYIDLVKGMAITFPIRYAAPNLAFSDNMGANGVAEESSIKDRIVLPIISFVLKGIEYDKERAIDPCVRYWYKPDSTDPSKVLVTTAPKPMNYLFQVDVWTEKREDFNQIVTAFQLDFNPYSYLMDLYSYEDETQKSTYVPYARMNLTSYSDSSNFVPGTDRRVVRGTFQITVNGWLSQPPTQMSYVFNTTTNINGEYSSSTNSVGTSINTPNFINSNWALGGSNTTGVSSIFGRQGVVVATPGDYTSEQVIIDQGVSGASAPGATLQTTLVNMEQQIAQDTFSIMLNEAMSPGTVFRIINQKAYKVKSIDSITPNVDGVVLVGGIANSIVTAGRKINTVYDLGIPQTTDSWLYLGQNGTLTSTLPTTIAGDIYLLIVGKSMAGTNSFIFDPKTVVKL